MITGISDVSIGDTVMSKETPIPLPPITVEVCYSLRMLFRVTCTVLCHDSLSPSLSENHSGCA
jgi:predicted membrane GTPase involved in stress response